MLIRVCVPFLPWNTYSICTSFSAPGETGRRREHGGQIRVKSLPNPTSICSTPEFTSTCHIRERSEIQPVGLGLSMLTNEEATSVKKKKKTKNYYVYKHNWAKNGWEGSETCTFKEKKTYYVPLRAGAGLLVWIIQQEHNNTCKSPKVNPRKSLQSHVCSKIHLGLEFLHVCIRHAFLHSVYLGMYSSTVIYSHGCMYMYKIRAYWLCMSFFLLEFLPLHLQDTLLTGADPP